MRYFIVPDLHGRIRLAQDLFAEADVPFTASARRERGVSTVQLGDLANCVLSDAQLDVQALRVGRELFDVILCGNHEHPYLGGPAFNGFFNVPEVKSAVLALYSSKKLRPCVRIGDVLLTHAGVSPDWGWTTAEEAQEAIGELWDASPASSVFSRIGQARGGMYRYGGILWSDYRCEPRAEFPQVHGHTPMPDGPHINGATFDTVDDLLPINVPRTGHQAVAINLDIGGGKGAMQMVGLWLDDDGNTELVRSSWNDEPLE